MNISDITQGTEYENLSLFSDAGIRHLEQRLIEREGKKGKDVYVSCVVRNKEIKLTPEEVVRQLYLDVLTEELGYPVSRLAVEYEVTFGREKKRADIVVFDKEKPTAPYIIVEVKKPKLKDGKERTIY